MSRAMTSVCVLDDSGLLAGFTWFVRWTKVLSITRRQSIPLFCVVMGSSLTMLFDKGSPLFGESKYRNIE